tara:strand:+ start:84 stop:476 length:393 start_codon:yes stop_codon:yes gene_type:complete
MTNESNKTDPARIDETHMEELASDQLQNAAGGSVLGDVGSAAGDAIDGVKDAAEWTFNHPGEVIAGAAVASGVGMAGYGIYSAVALGQGTAGFVAAAAGVATVAGGAVAGAAEGVAHGVKDVADDIENLF